MAAVEYSGTYGHDGLVTGQQIFVPQVDVAAIQHLSDCHRERIAERRARDRLEAKAEIAIRHPYLAKLLVWYGHVDKVEFWASMLVMGYYVAHCVLGLL